MKIMEEIRSYVPCNQQEAGDREVILQALETEQDIFTRKNRLAHMCASAWVVNHQRTKVLMAYHNIYQSWAWLGGHADGEEDLRKVALREVSEESGLHSITAVSQEIFSLEVLPVDGHMKHGAYVPAHLHLNVTYLVEADEEETLTGKADENSGTAWFSPEEAVEKSTEPWIREHIYRKLNEKLRCLQKNT